MALSIPVEVGLASPQSLINFYLVPDCDNTYSNVHRFGAKTLADQFFSQYRKVSIVQSKCTRYPDKVRIPFNADYIRQFNYMGFQNSDVYDVGTSAQNTGTPTYNGIYSPQGGNDYASFVVYCFVNDVQWVNVHCCDVFYTVDVFSTYFPLATLERSFVMRSHQYQDNNEKVGDSYEPEPVNVNAYQIDTDIIVDARTLTGAIIVEYNPKEATGGLIINGNYAPTIPRAFSTAEGANAFIKEHPEEITAVYQLPYELVRNDIDTGSGVGANTPPWYGDTTINSCYIPDHSDIRNKKCFQYPFCYSTITTPNGSKIVLKNELFNSPSEPNGTQQVSWYCAFAYDDTTLAIYPKDYMGSPREGSFIPNTMTPNVGGVEPALIAYMNDFPQCAFDGDTLSAYFANGKFQQALFNIGATAIGSAIGAATIAGAFGGKQGVSGILGGASGIIDGLASMGGDIVANVFAPDNTLGRSTGKSGVANGTYDILINYYYPIRDELQHLDDFFEMFGYAVNKVDKVDVMQRPFWCYYQVPDINFHVDGDIAIPPYAIVEIKQAFARGITFWNRDKRFGDYTGNNHTS